MTFERKQTKRLYVRDVPVGGNAPVAVQTMQNTNTKDVDATVRQIHEVAEAGCEITRVAVPDRAAAAALADIVRQSPIPVVADIHFKADLALRSIEAGCDALRINPGNIGSEEGVAAIAEAAKKAGIPIRVGVNSGSVHADIRDEFGGINEKSICHSAIRSVAMLEKYGFTDICISVKASDPGLTIKTYREMSRLTDYPLHLGVTEAGTEREGIIRSSVGIGTLLAEGIGDTIRVSLTADPVKEIGAAYSILRSLALRDRGAMLVSCPTCGRTEVDLTEMAARIEDYLSTVKEPIKVAVMGCVVNGPGEAREADCGIAGGREKYMIFRKGERVKTVPETEAMNALIEEIERCRAAYRETTEE